MLSNYYKSPWRRLSVAGSPSVGALLAGAPLARSIGFTLGTGDSPGLARVGGVASVCEPWGAAAAAVVKIERRSGRVFAVLAWGAVNNLPPPLGPRTIPGTPDTVVPGTPERFEPGTPGKFRKILVALGSQQNAPTGMVRSGSVRNPFPEQASVYIHGGVDDYVTINGRRVGSSGGNVSQVNERFTVSGGASVSYALFNPSGGFAGGNLSFEFTVRATEDRIIPATPDTIIPGTPDQHLPAEDPLVVADRNAAAAIPFLNTGGAVGLLPWFPVAEAYARAGVWMRQRAWADPLRRMRFEAGAGTDPAVAVVIDEDRPVADEQLNTDFGAAQFLATDWEPYVAIEEEIFLDVTDFQFDWLLGGGAGFYFAVENDGSDPPPDDPVVDPPPPEPPLPPTGTFVKVLHNGVEIWAPAVPFGCPVPPA